MDILVELFQFDDNVLTGFFPESLAALLNLQDLVLQDNHLAGPLPSSVGFISSLLYLDVGANKLTGRVPEGLGNLHALDSFFIRENRFVEQMPSGIGTIRSLCYMEVAWNELAGRLPDGLGNLRALAVLDLSDNHFTASLPHSLGCLAAMLHFHALGNRLDGPLPDDLGNMIQLEILQALGNMLSGALPHCLGLLTSLRVFDLQVNCLSGSIPSGLRTLKALGGLPLHGNKFAGAIPDCICSLRGLHLILLSQNRFRGRLPEALGDMLLLDIAQMDRNLLRGPLPEALRYVLRMRDFHASLNDLSGTIPVSIGALRDLSELSIRGNGFSGAIPGGLARNLAMEKIMLDSNEFQGTLGSSFCGMSKLTTLLLSDNGFSGSMPACLWSASELRDLWLGEGALSGTLPSSLCALRSLIWLKCDGIRFEGSLPSCLGSLSSLEFVDVKSSRGRGGRGLEGTLPSGISRASQLMGLRAAGNHLEGDIPHFSSTLWVLALNDNDLETMSELRFFTKQTGVLLHNNRLSCQPTRCQVCRPCDISEYDYPTCEIHGGVCNEHSGGVRVALAAVGNHLTMPDTFPDWIMPFERDGLLWVSSSRGKLHMGQTLAGALVLLLVVRCKIGFGKCLQSVLSWWRMPSKPAGGLARASSSFNDNMTKWLLGSSALLILVLDSDFYACPGMLALASACAPSAARKHIVRFAVVALWHDMYEYACDPWWLERPEKSIGREPSVAWKRHLSWAVWLVFVLVLSQLVVVNEASKCVPAFLPGSGVSLRLLSLIIGGLQGLIASIVLPRLAALCPYVPRASLVSIAGSLGSYIIPALVVVYFDGECLDRWTEWWRPCRRSNEEMFEVTMHCSIMDSFYIRSRSGGLFWMECAQVFELSLVALHSKDLCMPRQRHLSAAACSRNLLWKMQDYLLGKLATTGLLMPAGRLFRGDLYTASSDVAVRFALLLEAALLFGPPLPLLMPLLGVNLLSDLALIVASCADGSLKFSSDEGSAKAAIISALVASFFIHAALIAEDSLASVLLISVVMIPKCLEDWQQICDATAAWCMARAKRQRHHARRRRKDPQSMRQSSSKRRRDGEGSSESGSSAFTSSRMLGAVSSKS